MKMDIFFFVTTVFVTLLAIVFIVIFIYITKIVRDVKKITEETKSIVSKIKSESMKIVSDVDDFRESSKKTIIRNKGKVIPILTTVLAIIKRMNKKKK